MGLPESSARTMNHPNTRNGRPTNPGHRAPDGPPPSWQLEMFERSLKKRQKLALILRLLGRLGKERCLLVTSGDNTGALNFHLRAAGGRWTWAELEAERIREMARLLGEPVEHVAPDRLPFPDGSFDRIVTIDVHEHLAEVQPLNREIARVLAPAGTAVVTTPNGDPRLPVAILKRLLGMTPEVYGHRVQGYTTAELQAMVRAVGLVPERTGAYSRLFTESIELAINFAYVKLLRGRGEEGGGDGIAPTSSGDLGEVKGAYRLYARVFPLLRAVAALDHLIPGKGGYAVAVAARKPARRSRPRVPAALEALKQRSPAGRRHDDRA
jgi:SAM-dependent methyltransferase